MKHHQIHLTLHVEVPDGVYLPDKFQITQQERDEARSNGMTENEAESAEREWAMFNIAKLAYEALGIVVTFGSASTHGSIDRITTNKGDTE